jgi:hypothetical protein
MTILGSNLPQFLTYDQSLNQISVFTMNFDFEGKHQAAMSV